MSQRYRNSKTPIPSENVTRMQMGLEYYLEDYLVIISRMRVNITKYNDRFERKLLPDFKKKDMEVYGIVAELA